MRRFHRARPVLAAVATAVFAAGAPASALEQLLNGTRLEIRNRGPATGARSTSARWLAEDSAIEVGRPGSAADPRCNGSPSGSVRASLRLFSRATGQDTGPLALPCQNWSLLGDAAQPGGYAYVDRRGADGPCRRVQLLGGATPRVEARCVSRGKGAPLDYELLPGIDEGTVGAVLRLGERRYCTAFDGVTRRDGSNGRQFVAGSSAAPESCPESSGLPPEIVRHGADWPLPNRDYANRRATTDSPITSANVAELEVAWRFPTPGFGGFGNLSTNPIVVGDAVYLQELSSEIHALERATGAPRWQKTMQLFSPGPNGVAVGYGRLFAANGQGEVVAFDAATGEELWRQTLRRTRSEGIDIQPVVFDRRVYVSTVPISLGGLYAGGDTGVLHALDVATGAVLWSFDTVDSPDVWGNPSVNSGGGAWYPPAIDAERRITYWGTGNPAPFPGVPDFPNGTSRPGPNLYTDSALAIDSASGELLWYHQVLPHDLLDHDFMLIALAEVAGEPVVVGAGKTGTVHAFRADTGDELWKVPVGEHFNDTLDAYPIGAKLLVSPGIFGGVITPFAIADGVVYVPVLNFATPYQGDLFDLFPFAGLESATSEVVALDLATGATLWTRDLPRPNFGATTVVNDLVFTSTYDGTLYALDRASGATRWTDRPGAGINAWPAVAGDTILFPAGVGASPELIAYRLQ
ncbi:MAG: PQQ-binding-like beta-propeller repeat protein [Deltaproteobacteria bacterium]|nr:MAG: PQQ-binding-like beta-propeller repeat protein [Deltaproteobacteria bacterium]